MRPVIYTLRRRLRIYISLLWIKTFLFRWTSGLHFNTLNFCISSGSEFASFIYCTALSGKSAALQHQLSHSETFRPKWHIQLCFQTSVIRFYWKALMTWHLKSLLEGINLSLAETLHWNILKTNLSVKSSPSFPWPSKHHPVPHRTLKALHV